MQNVSGGGSASFNNFMALLTALPEDLSSQCDGATTIFTTTKEINAIVFCSLNGSLLLNGKEVSKTATNQITLTFAPNSGEELFLKYV